MNDNASTQAATARQPRREPDAGKLKWLTGPFVRWADNIRGSSAPGTARGFGGQLFNVGFAFILLYALVCIGLGVSLGSSAGERSTIAFAAAMFSLAAACVGALLGFIFAIPRALQAPDLPADSKYTRFLVNTNFEQISDWLTKILVGVSLVQIGNIRPALGALGRTLAPMLGSPTNANGISSQARGAIGVAMCLAAALLAFLICYLWTRVTLTSFFDLFSHDEDSLADNAKPT